MTIQITKPAIEALIRERLETGVFENVEDLIFQSLRSPAWESADSELSCKTLDELFEPIRGLADDLDFDRNRSIARPVDL